MPAAALLASPPTVARSSSTVRTPRAASARAVAQPTRPPPMTTASAVRGSTESVDVDVVAPERVLVELGQEREALERAHAIEIHLAVQVIALVLHDAGMEPVRGEA